MKRTSVSSLNFASIGYDPENMILEIEFNNGGIYQYFDIPESEYNWLMAADSKGRYFNVNIKDSCCQFEEIR